MRAPSGGHIIQGALDCFKFQLQERPLCVLEQVDLIKWTGDGLDVLMSIWCVGVFVDDLKEIRLGLLVG